MALVILNWFAHQIHIYIYESPITAYYFHFYERLKWFWHWEVDIQRLASKSIVKYKKLQIQNLIARGNIL